MLELVATHLITTWVKLVLYFIVNFEEMNNDYSLFIIFENDSKQSFSLV